MFDASQIFGSDSGFDLRRIVKIAGSNEIIKAVAPLIAYEDNHLLVIFKPAGWLSQSDETGDASVNEIFAAYLKVKYGKPGNVFCAAVQRLDRPASGLMVLARTSKAAARLSEQIRAGRFEKRYRVITPVQLAGTKGDLSRTVLTATMRKVDRMAKRVDTTVADSGASLYTLTATLCGSAPGVYEYEVELESGKFHQIRALFAAHGSPLLGDVKYGGKKLNNHSDRIALACTWLNFLHPTLKTPIIQTLTPDSLRRLRTYFI